MKYNPTYLKHIQQVEKDKFNLFCDDRFKISDLFKHITLNKQNIFNAMKDDETFFMEKIKNQEIILLADHYTNALLVLFKKENTVVLCKLNNLSNYFIINDEKLNSISKYFITNDEKMKGQNHDLSYVNVHGLIHSLRETHQNYIEFSYLADNYEEIENARNSNKMTVSHLLNEYFFASNSTETMLKYKTILQSQEMSEFFSSLYDLKIVIDNRAKLIKKQNFLLAENSKKNNLQTQQSLEKNIDELVIFLNMYINSMNYSVSVSEIHQSL